MKAFLKERIYGRIENFNKKNIHNKNHMRSLVTERERKTVKNHVQDNNVNRSVDYNGIEK